MSLSVGIVGLPNVGKSTLFNAVLQKQQALAANYPFATIEPNVGVVEVPDERLEKLADVIQGINTPLLSKAEGPSREGKRPPKVYATVEFVDIAGLVKGASEGEGLGNKFLAHIRETDAIVHVLRAFADENVVRSGAVDPAADLEVIRTELILKDMETLEKLNIKDKKLNIQIKNQKVYEAAVEKLREGLAKGLTANAVLNKDELEEVRELWLLTAKPELYVLNVDESGITNQESWDQLTVSYAGELGVPKDAVVVLCAKLESELVELSGEEKTEYLQSVGMSEPGLERLIKAAYATLDLQSFLTAGEKEVRAWTIRRGDTALVASGVIHTDFMKNFIKAKVCGYDDFVSLEGWQKAAEAGKVRMEGRDYVVKDGDVIEFMIGK